MDYGIVRISTDKQNMERQCRNILAEYPNAVIVKETYTGTKLAGRTEFARVLKRIKKGDRLIFDSVSRMSRNAKEGWELYEKLYNEGIELIFLKEKHINTENYRKTLENQIKLEVNTGNKATDEFINSIIESMKNYTMALAKKQVMDAFKDAEEEVNRLHQRTKEGMLTAKLEGKQIGREAGTTIETKKAKAIKELILKHSKTFDGTLKDDEVMALASSVGGVHRETYYIYKKQLKEEMAKLGI